MRRRIVIFIAMVVASLIGVRIVHQRRIRVELKPSRYTPAIQSVVEQHSSTRRTNALGDTLTDAQAPEFQDKVFAKFREFVATMDRLGVNPFKGEPQSASCGKIRVIHIPNGIICRFVIGDGWAADYMQNESFSGITYFGQRGPDNPNRAISHADTNALRRLAQNAIHMPEAEAWKIADRVADAFGIDRSKFEKPEMYEEGLFEYRLGIHIIQYRKKGSDPLNGLNYTRDFSLKATSPTTAVLVSYSHLEATLTR